MAVLVLVDMGLIIHMASGPLWDIYIHSSLLVPCKRNWWTTIFHFQNYVHPTEMVCTGLEER